MDELEVFVGVHSSRCLGLTMSKLLINLNLLGDGDIEVKSTELVGLD